jgi:hypothetical protein
MPESDSGALKWRQFLGSLVVLCLVVGLFGALIWFVITQIRSLDSEVAAAVITASATVVVSVILVVLGRYFEKKRELEAQAREKKIPLYEEFIDFWFRVLYAKKMGGCLLRKRCFPHWTNDLEARRVSAIRNSSASGRRLC